MINLSEPTIQEIVELLSSAQDVATLGRFFSILCGYLLSSNISHEQIVKCEMIYDKIHIVLRSGLHSEVIKALDLICALQYLDREEGQTKSKTLQMLAKNMIRISGCLTAMVDLFTNFMMRRDTWEALCRSISKTCDICTLNQTQCSHLVPLCVQRCRRENLETVIILQSLLRNHSDNVKLFHASKGMAIFTREILQKAACLQLLNIVIENTKPENRDELLKATALFRDIHYLRQTYGSESPMGQWAQIILFSCYTVLGTPVPRARAKNVCNTSKQNSIDVLYTSIDNRKQVFKDNDKENDSGELLQNVLTETNAYQRKRSNSTCTTKYRDVHYCNKNIARHSNVPTLFRQTHNKTNNRQAGDLSGNYTFIDSLVMGDTQNYSFLTRENLIESRFRKPNYDLIRKRNYFEVMNSNSQQTHGHLYRDRSVHSDDREISRFEPPFVSTPRTSNRSVIVTSPRDRDTSLRSKISKRSQRNKQHDIIKHINVPQSKQSRNMSFSAKLFDIVNGSCSTIRKGFSALRNMLTNKNEYDKIRTKPKDDATDVDQRNIISCSFTNYMRKRDAYFAELDKQSDAKYSSRQFGEERNSLRCLTCNDTAFLERKLTTDALLQQTVKKLKFAINVYGCDFKKISKMWRDESYMTPQILYNLYRKLIIKQ